MKHEIIELHDVQIIGMAKQIAFNVAKEECPKFWGEYVEKIIKPVVFEKQEPNEFQRAAFDNGVGEFGLCTCDIPNHNCATCWEANFGACCKNTFTYVIGGIYKGNDQQNNEKLIADMAKEYALMDYDQMDGLNRQISDAILNGELMKADSLLRSKGDMNSRDAEITRRLEAEAKEENDLAQRASNLAASKEGTRKLLEDFGEDCYNYYTMCLLEHKYDSAAYYIELRANRDTTNADWQFEAAFYLYNQNQYRKSQVYYERALQLYQCLAASDPETYEKNVADMQNNLAVLYSDTKRFSEAERMYLTALETRQRLATSNPEAYEPGLARTLNNLAVLYMDTQRFEEAEKMYLSALEIRQRLASSNPEVYDPDVADTQNNMANLYCYTQRFAEAEKMYLSALKTYHRLVVSNPGMFESHVAGTLNNLAIPYRETQQYEEAEKVYIFALEIYQRLAASNPDAYGPRFASTLGGIAINSIFMKHYVDAENYAREGLKIDSTKQWILANLAAALLFQGKYDEAEAIYRQYKDELKDSFLDDFKQYAEAGVIPPDCEAEVEKIKQMLEE